MIGSWFWSEGRVEEFDSPKELLEVDGGVFRGAVEKSGEREGLVRKILEM